MGNSPPNRTWNDFALSGAPLHFHVIDPQPSFPAAGIAAHVLIVQNALDEFSTSVFTGYDQLSIHPGPAFQVALTTSERLEYEPLVIGLGLAPRCLPSNSVDYCAVRHGEIPLEPNHPILIRDGSGIELHITPSKF